MAVLQVQQHNANVLESLEAGDLVEFKRGVYSHWAVYIGIDIFLSFYFFQVLFMPQIGETYGFYSVPPSSELCLVYNFVNYG
jgi:hypothetical protein